MTGTLLYNISKFQFLQRDELPIARAEEYFEVNRPANIYFILSKNRISIDPSFIDFDDKEVRVRFKIEEKDTAHLEEIKMDHTYTDLKSLTIQSKFPHSEFLIVDEFNTPLYGKKATYFLEAYYNSVNRQDLLDYEILYIGKSISSDNSTPVLTRINKHEKFIQILEDNSRTYRDKEIFLLLISFKDRILMDYPENAADEDRKNFSDSFKRLYLNRKPNENFSVDFLEASLINHFKPKYNSIYKNSLDDKHKVIENLKSLLISKVQLEIGLENYLPKLYTKNAPRSDNHIIRIEANKE